jgi:hypothetical protein
MDGPECLRFNLVQDFGTHRGVVPAVAVGGLGTIEVMSLFIWFLPQMLLVSGASRIHFAVRDGPDYVAVS